MRGGGRGGGEERTGERCSALHLQEFHTIMKHYSLHIEVTIIIIKFHWNILMYTMLPDSIPEK